MVTFPVTGYTRFTVTVPALTHAYGCATFTVWLLPAVGSVHGSNTRCLQFLLVLIPHGCTGLVAGYLRLLRVTVSYPTTVGLPHTQVTGLVLRLLLLRVVDGRALPYTHAVIYSRSSITRRLRFGLLPSSRRTGSTTGLPRIAHLYPFPVVTGCTPVPLVVATRFVDTGYTPARAGCAPDWCIYGFPSSVIPALPFQVPVRRERLVGHDVVF